MLVKAYGSSVVGVNAFTITVEVSVGKGTKYILVGLPDNAVKESWHRIEAALKHNDLSVPRKKIVVNLAPADIRKEGSAYDLTIAAGILAASGQVATECLENYIVLGELSLDGEVKPIRGSLPIAIQAKKEGFSGFILPKANAREAGIVDGLRVIGIGHINELVEVLEDENSKIPEFVDTRAEFIENLNGTGPNFSDVKGQENIKRAMEIAAAGGHNMIMIGPPGAGKTMLARRLSSILPPLSLKEALETTKIHSVAGLLNPGDTLIYRRPFRSPHHTISDVALVGGGNHPQPGEISLAHNGVLFLDELPEFKRGVLEVLRQPMETRTINISRAKFNVTYPASFMLVASLNPCPCGFFSHPTRQCVCPPGVVQKYFNRISGPLLDRIDLHVEVTPVPFKELESKTKGETSASIRERVIQARKIQNDRFEKDRDVHCNAQIPPRLIRSICEISTASSQLLKTAIEKLNLSVRAYDRILKVARTIADLENSSNIKSHHVAEAIQYRSLDREGWGM